jgi:dTDP-L-rhamnose 4-epimerase
MTTHVLITGGAGFIGSHLADALLADGHRVRAFDSLEPQVHGADRRRPAYLDPEVELQVGDVRDSSAVRRALNGVDSVVHLAALVGVGQSMYEIERYADVNTTGTAVLLQALVEQPVERLVVASSMSVYGEGLYQRPDGARRPGHERSIEQLRAGTWELTDDDGAPLTPVPTPETKQPSLASVYALSKYDQERLSLVIGRTYGIPTVALRFFNAYGTRQALSNPYTGVLAIFASRLLNANPPRIFEDGRQQRDFVSVRDVVAATRLALTHAGAPGRVFNVASGQHHTVLEVAARIARVLGREDIEPELTASARAGDIRHCFADINEIQQRLGYEPRVSLDTGLEELAEWLADQVAEDRVAEASRELAARGLTV